MTKQERREVLGVLNQCHCQGEGWQREFGKRHDRCGICREVLNYLDGDVWRLAQRLKFLVTQDFIVSSWVSAPKVVKPDDEGLQAIGQAIWQFRFHNETDKEKA